MENRNRFGLDKMNDELVNDILPFEINLPKNQKNLLATLIYINGIDNKDKDGFFYVDNKYLMEVLGVSEPTIISNANKLIEKGFIQRVTGKKNHPSKYLVTDLIKEYTKEYTKDFSKYTKEYTKDFSKYTKEYTKDFSKYTKEYTKKYTKNFSKNFSKTVENFSQDKDIDKEKDKEYIFNIINNIIKENNINLINNIKNIIKKEIENIKEKENNSSINEKSVESEKQMNDNESDLNDDKKQSSTNDDVAALSTSSINLDENNEQGICDESNCSINQQPSTTVEEERKDSAEKKEDTNEVISSPTASDNDTTLTTIHQEEEKPTECKEMPLNGKKLRYLDTYTNKQYDTEAEAQQDGANPWYLYDFKVERCLTSYTSSLSPSNDPSGITIQDEQEKPTESKEMPSMAIVTDDATPKEEEKAKKHMYFKEVTTLNDEILDELKKNYSINEWPNLFKIDMVNKTIQSKTSRDILGYGEESKELRDRISMDSKETKRLMKMVGVGV